MVSVRTMGQQSNYSLPNKRAPKFVDRFGQARERERENTENGRKHLILIQIMNFKLICCTKWKCVINRYVIIFGHIKFVPMYIMNGVLCAGWNHVRTPLHNLSEWWWWRRCKYCQHRWMLHTIYVLTQNLLNGVCHYSLILYERVHIMRRTILKQSHI